MSRVPTDVAVKDRAEGFRAISPTVHQASSFPREKKKNARFFKKAAAKSSVFFFFLARDDHKQ